MKRAFGPILSLSAKNYMFHPEAASAYITREVLLSYIPLTSLSINNAFQTYPSSALPFSTIVLR
jgi:hypothetical protein